MAGESGVRRANLARVELAPDSPCHLPSLLHCAQTGGEYAIPGGPQRKQGSFDRTSSPISYPAKTATRRTAIMIGGYSCSFIFLPRLEADCRTSRRGAADRHGFGRRHGVSDAWQARIERRRKMARAPRHSVRGRSSSAKRRSAPARCSASTMRAGRWSHNSPWKGPMFGSPMSRRSTGISAPSAVAAVPCGC